LSDRIHVIDHPLIQHKLTIARNATTGTKKFREVIHELSLLMGYEATKGFPLRETEIEGPIQRAKTFELAGKKVAVVAVLRSGLGMVDGILELIPNAKVGHVGMFRDPETLEPKRYFCQLPDDIDRRQVLVLDPMLATGGSAIATIQLLKDRGANDVSLICIIAAPEGIHRVAESFAGVHIYTCAIDEHLDGSGLIVPGLGDVGDRLFGTESPRTVSAEECGPVHD